jgi:hypothetical protein
VLGGSVPSIQMEGSKCLPNSEIKLFHENKGEHLGKRR